MAENSKIAGTNHTFNPWRGCTKVSEGCANCYAATMSKRNPATLGTWGANGTRVVAAESAWRQPLKWDRAAASASERHRVFCASLADVFEDWQGRVMDSGGNVIWRNTDETWERDDGSKDFAYRRQPLTMSDVRTRLFALIDSTPNLDWLLLTKRPENIARLWPFGWYDDHFTWPNLWLGASVENQEQADRRIPLLLKTPAAVRFLSVEPLLGPVDLEPFLQYEPFHENYKMTFSTKEWRGIDWAIVGGESGPGARPMHPDWVRSIRDSCLEAKVPFFFKQGSKDWGDFKNFDAFPDDLKIRQFPTGMDSLRPRTNAQCAR